jgi:hypothetical protein
MSIGGLVWVGSGWDYMQFLKHKHIQMGLLVLQHKSFQNDLIFKIQTYKKYLF